MTLEEPFLSKSYSRIIDVVVTGGVVQIIGVVAVATFCYEK